VIAGTTTNFLHSEKEKRAHDIALKNIESLSSGEEPTSVKTCYIRLSSPFDTAHLLFCHPDQNETTQFACPDVSFGHYCNSCTLSCTP